MKRIYLDHAATTPVHPEVLAAMTPYFTEKFGNPSTIYYFGREAKEGIEIAREVRESHKRRCLGDSFHQRRNGSG